MKKTGIEIIADERQRQVVEEGWASEHDDQHDQEQLACAAAYYALSEDVKAYMDIHWGNDMHLTIWPFDLSWYKPTPNDRIHELEAEKDKIEIKLLDAYDRLSKLGDAEQWAKAVEAENKRLREEQLFQNAINQFIGYGFGKHQDLIEMVASMGLRKEEWDRWKKDCRPSRDLTTYDIRDIDNYFSTLPQPPKEQ